MKQIFYTIFGTLFFVISFSGCEYLSEEKDNSPEENRIEKIDQDEKVISDESEEFEKDEEIDERIVSGFEIEIISDTLQNPWGMDFLDENFAIITEKRRSLFLVNLQNGNKEEISGLPEISVEAQGGLLDILLDENFIYLTYSAQGNGGSATHLGRGVLNVPKSQIENFEVLHIAEPFMRGGAHFGSRILLDSEYLYFSTGDREQKNFGEAHVSQDLLTELGKVLRLHKDGTIPEDSPFANMTNAKKSIYTYGHRNIQGMAIHPNTGEIWISEHGERNGDEINILRSGGNYGWPIASFGCRYGTSIPVGENPVDREDLVDPVYFWECGSGGFPPSGMTFYIGEKFPEWHGDLFMGNLAGKYLGRFSVDDNNNARELDPLLSDLNFRIRDVSQSPDGYLYVLTDENPGKVIKLSPKYING